MPRTIRQAALVLACVALAAGCSGSGTGEVVSSADLVFVESGTPGNDAVDWVRLTGTADPARGEVTLSVVGVGPTTSADLYSFAFDLGIGDPALVSYVPDSILAGPAIPGSVEAVAGQHGDRIVIGFTKLGALAGSPLAAGEQTIVSLVLTVHGNGSSTVRIAGSPPNTDPLALDSSGDPVPSVRFDTAAARIVRM